MAMGGWSPSTSMTNTSSLAGTLPSGLGNRLNRQQTPTCLVQPREGRGSSVPCSNYEQWPVRYATWRALNKKTRSDDRGGSDFLGRSARIRTPDIRFWRPTLYQLSYAPTRMETGAPGGIRTPDALLRTEALYPLSYRGLVEIGGLEPPTSALRTQRSPG